MRQRAQALEQVVLRLRVQRRRRFVEQQDPCVLAHERPREGDLLPLTSGQVDPGVEPFTEGGVVALGQVRDQLVRSRLFACADHGLPVCDLRDIPKPDVLRCGRLVIHVVLEHRADLPPQLVGFEIANVDAVDQNPSFLWVVQPADELEERRLAGSVSPDHRQCLPRLDGEAEVGQRVRVGSRVREREMVEPDLSAQLRGHRGWLTRHFHRRLLRHQLVEVVQIEVVLIHSREAAEDRLDRALDLRRSLCVKAQVADRQLARDRQERDVHVSDSGDDRADVAQSEAGHVPAHELGPLAAVKSAGDETVALDEIPAEPEELDLLGEGVGRHERDHVVHPAQQARAPARDVVATPAVPRVGDERRDGRHE